MINQEQIAAYKEMAKNASENSMEAQIKANLEDTCDKFKGNEDKFDRCMAFLNKVCMEILGGADAAEGDENGNYKTLSGDIPDEVCFRICRDYFNDEIWKAEDEEKVAKEAKRKADNEKLDKIRAEKKAKKPVKKTASQVEKESVNKEKHGCKPTEPEKKFQVCTECGEECLYLYKGLCITCYHKKREAEDAKMEKIFAERETIAKKNLAIIEENNKNLGIGLAETIDLFGTGK